MNSEQLKQFVAIADMGTMTAASEKLHISQPALSATLAKLESELGCALFDRVGRRLVLNENGKELYPHAVNVISELDLIEAEFKEKRSERLTIYSVHPVYLEHAVNTLFEEVGYDRLSTGCIYDQSICDMLLKGRANAIIAPDYYMDRHMSGDIQMLHLATDQLYLCVTLEDPLAERDSVSIRELQYMHMARCTNPGLCEWNYDTLEKYGVSVIYDISVDGATMKKIRLDTPLPYFANSCQMTSENMGELFNYRKMVRVEEGVTRINLYWHRKNAEKNAPAIEKIVQHSSVMPSYI